MTLERSHLVIAGVPKAGTTSLFEYLAQHPDVYPSIIRQTAFFKQPGDLEDYLANFRGATDERWLMESTPGYLARGREVAERIRSTLDTPRVVVSLRDPVDRFVSHYRMKLRADALGARPPSLAQYVEDAVTGSDTAAANTLRLGAYADHVTAWHDVFGDSLHIVFFDRLADEPRAVLRELCEWLGIDPAPVAEFDLSPRNRGVRHRSRLVADLAQRASWRLRPFFQRFPATRGILRSLHHVVNGAEPDAVRLDDTAAARQRLEDWYRPSNERLVALLRGGDRPLPAWLSATGGVTTAPEAG